MKSPNIPPLCGSHWKWCAPSTSVTTQVVVPVSGTVVVRFRPAGPVRWKLWFAVSSLISISYVPAGTEVTGVPFGNFRSIVKSPRTVPIMSAS